MSIPRDEIRNRLQALLERTRPKSAPAAEVSEGTPFADLRFDSLALMELAYEVEESFKISIADDELAALKTVGDLMNVIEQRATTV